jgi:hypothetical protein
MQPSFSVFKFALAFFALVSTSQLSCAAPIPEGIAIRDVYVPPIIEPSASAVWTIGTTQVVTWDTTHPPQQISNKYGRIVLRSEETGRLDYEHPLADGFDILNGCQEVTVPNVNPGTYQIVLFGDSGNWGQSFQIVAAGTPAVCTNGS